MGHKYVVFGTGRMGRAVAWYLVNEPSTDRVKLVDYNAAAARALGKQFVDAGFGHKVELADHAPSRGIPAMYNENVKDPLTIESILYDSHVCVATCGYQEYEKIAGACIKKGVSMVDLGGNREVVDHQKKLHDDAKKANVTIIPDCGLAPGMIGILGMHAFEQIKRRRVTDIDVQMRVGGLPANPGSVDENPLQYALTWSSDGLINEYVIPADVLRDGKLIQVPALTELEDSIIKTPWGHDKFEAFVTGGGSSNLPFLLSGHARNVDYKTLRYRGHCRIMNALGKLGFFSHNAVNVPKVRHDVTYRDVLVGALDENLQLTSDDVVIARAGARGVLSNGNLTGILYEVFCAQQDVFGQNFSAMAQTTGFSAGIIAKMIADNVVKAKGVVDGEVAVPGKQFIDALRKTGITFKETNR